MIRSLLPLFLLALAGCASELSGSDFTKPGVTSAQRMSDTQYCFAYADKNRGPVAAGPQGAAEQKERRTELFNTCMMDRGYRPI